MSSKPVAAVLSWRPSKLTTLLASMTFCGLVSGLLTSYLINNNNGSLPLMGSIFGAALALCLVLLDKLRIWWLPVFWLVSGGAFVVSIDSLALPDLWMRALGKNFSEASFFAYPDHPARFFICGFIGAFVLFATAIRPLVFRGIALKRTGRLGLIWCIAGGVLGVIALQSGPALGNTLCSFMDSRGCASNDMLNTLYSLCPVWQTGMAFVLACLLHAHERFMQNQQHSAVSIPSDNYQGTVSAGPPGGSTGL
ncbi:MAG TPA: hypothetical protein VJW20_21215 [Candidatus Angelobacter sp.]|nr:hypothetical protein [Candidatus Angelobacter sp.]